MNGYVCVFILPKVAPLLTSQQQLGDSTSLLFCITQSTNANSLEAVKILVFDYLCNPLNEPGKRLDDLLYYITLRQRDIWKRNLVPNELRGSPYGK